MKYIKVLIKKENNGHITNFIYPDGYDCKKIEPVCYQNEGLEYECAIAITNDDFVCVKGLEEITKDNALQLISDYITNNKDINLDNLQEGKTLDDIISSKQSYIN